jgi:hypothetical protein
VATVQFSVVGTTSRRVAFPAVHASSRGRLFINQSFFEQSRQVDFVIGGGEPVGCASTSAYPQSMRLWRSGQGCRPTPRELLVHGPRRLAGSNAVGAACNGHPCTPLIHGANSLYLRDTNAVNIILSPDDRLGIPQQPSSAAEPTSRGRDDDRQVDKRRIFAARTAQ